MSSHRLCYSPSSSLLSSHNKLKFYVLHKNRRKKERVQHSRAHINDSVSSLLVSVLLWLLTPVPRRFEHIRKQTIVPSIKTFLWHLDIIADVVCLINSCATNFDWTLLLPLGNIHIYYLMVIIVFNIYIVYSLEYTIYTWHDKHIFLYNCWSTFCHKDVSISLLGLLNICNMTYNRFDLLKLCLT